MIPNGVPSSWSALLACGLFDLVDAQDRASLRLVCKELFSILFGYMEELKLGLPVLDASHQAEVAPVLHLPAAEQLAKFHNKHKRPLTLTISQQGGLPAALAKLAESRDTDAKVGRTYAAIDYFNAYLVAAAQPLQLVERCIFHDIKALSWPNPATLLNLSIALPRLKTLDLMCGLEQLKDSWTVLGAALAQCSGLTSLTIGSRLAHAYADRSGQDEVVSLIHALSPLAQRLRVLRLPNTCLMPAALQAVADTLAYIEELAWDDLVLDAFQILVPCSYEALGQKGATVPTPRPRQQSPNREDGSQNHGASHAAAAAAAAAASAAAASASSHSAASQGITAAAPHSSSSTADARAAMPGHATRTHDSTPTTALGPGPGPASASASASGTGVPSSAAKQVTLVPTKAPASSLPHLHTLSFHAPQGATLRRSEVKGLLAFLPGLRVLAGAGLVMQHAQDGPSGPGLDLMSLASACERLAGCADSWRVVVRANSPLLNPRFLAAMDAQWHHHHHHHHTQQQQAQEHNQWSAAPPTSPAAPLSGASYASGRRASAAGSSIIFPQVRRVHFVVPHTLDAPSTALATACKLFPCTRQLTLDVPARYNSPASGSHMGMGMGCGMSMHAGLCLPGLCMHVACLLGSTASLNELQELHLRRVGGEPLAFCQACCCDPLTRSAPCQAHSACVHVGAAQAVGCRDAGMLAGQRQGGAVCSCARGGSSGGGATCQSTHGSAPVHVGVTSASSSHSGGGSDGSSQADETLAAGGAVLTSSASVGAACTQLRGCSLQEQIATAGAAALGRGSSCGTRHSATSMGNDTSSAKSSSADSSVVGSCPSAPYASASHPGPGTTGTSSDASTASGSAYGNGNGNVGGRDRCSGSGSGSVPLLCASCAALVALASCAPASVHRLVLGLGERRVARAVNGALACMGSACRVE